MNTLKYFLAFLLLVAACKKEAALNKKVTANDFLSDRNYDKLVLEIQAVGGFHPDSQTIAALQTFLEQRLHKPGGISIVLTSIASPGKTAYSQADIEAIEKASRTQKTKEGTLTAYLLCLDGDYASNTGNTKALGIAYANTAMAIFEKTIRDYSGGLGEPSTATLETTVIEHEIGHLFGLVNSGTPLRSAHDDGSHHCTNTNCLMYHQVETTDIVANLLNGVPELDADCINDLKGNGGK